MVKNSKTIDRPKLNADKPVEISITKNDRKELAHALSLLPADTYALYLKTQNFHWNIKGARFPSLHLLFESQYLELAPAVDLIAERIRALGELAPASFSEFSKLTCLEEGNSHISANEMVEVLMHDHERVAQSARTMVPKAEKIHDYGSVDLFSQRMASHEKTAWMLRSTNKL